MFWWITTEWRMVSSFKWISISENLPAWQCYVMCIILHVVLVLFISIFRVGVMSHMIMPINIKIFRFRFRCLYSVSAWTVKPVRLLRLKSCEKYIMDHTVISNGTPPKLAKWMQAGQFHSLTYWHILVLEVEHLKDHYDTVSTLRSFDWWSLSYLIDMHVRRKLLVKLLCVLLFFFVLFVVFLQKWRESVMEGMWKDKRWSQTVDYII